MNIILNEENQVTADEVHRAFRFWRDLSNAELLESWEDCRNSDWGLHNLNLNDESTFQDWLVAAAEQAMIDSSMNL